MKITPAAPFWVIVGPTASGKSRLGLDWALKCNGEIVGCDSVQVFRSLDLGSAKPSAEERQLVPHHLIDICDPLADFDAHRYAELARQAISDIQRRGKTPVVVGGTGLYLRTLLGEQFHDLPQDENLRAQLATESTETLYAELSARDPGRAQELHCNDRVRILRALEIATLTGRTFHENIMAKSAPRFEGAESSWHSAARIVFLNPPRSLLHRRIAERTQVMIAGGLVEEVKRLLNSGVHPGAKPMQSIGYKQVCEVLSGQAVMSELHDKIVFATRQYAKRQITWFRKIAFDIVVESPEEGLEWLSKQGQKP